MPFRKTAKTYGNKKDVGVSSSVLIPAVRPSHCPLMRISNVKPAHVSRDIYAYTAANVASPIEDETELRMPIHALLPPIYAKTVHPSEMGYTLLYI